MQTSLFFNISRHDFIKMVEKREITVNDNFHTIFDIIRALHIDIESGTFNIEKSNYLLEFLNKIPSLEKDDSNIHELYRKGSAYFYGDNILFEQKRQSFFKIVVGYCGDKTLMLLFLVGVLSLIIGLYKTVEEHERYGWVEGVSIMFAIVIIILMGTFNVYSQANLFDNLNKKTQDISVKIYKNFTMDTIQSVDILVGDIIFLEPGDVIPADCLLITDDDVMVDESMISGERDSKSKSFGSDPFLISGTYLTEGSAKALVICTGMNSVKGKILKQMNNRDKKTPLELKIEVLASSLTEKSFLVAFLLFSCHLVKMGVGRTPYDMRTIILLLIESISIVIMAVPEGLPMVVTLALSFCTKRMLSDNILVRDISACETMNNTNYICTDKTGTLTHNELIIRYLFVGNKIFYINERNFNQDNDFCLKISKHTSAELVFKNMILNSSAFEDSKNVFIGSKSEIAFLKILKKQKIDYEKLRREYKIIRKKPFSSNHKYMSTIIKYKKKFYVFYKGAPERLEKYCINENSDGKISSFKSANHSKFIRKCDRRCFRIMSFAYAVMDVFDPDALNLGKVPCTFLCAVAMEDLLRYNVKREIDQCKQAGINIVMFTGDKMAIAEHLAIRLGIHAPENLSITGNFMREKSDDDLKNIIENVKVLAKATPEDKKRFVEILQSKGNIVAVTGDGTNDGPALKTANVGFGMGIGGTDIAKEASSMILLNDDFSSIVKSIEWGRCVNNSVRRYIQFQLTTTITTIVIALLNSVLSMPGNSMFSPLKLLWINLIMGIFAALALSTDKPSQNYSHKSPEPQFMPIITSFMKIFIVTTSIYQFFIMGLLYITKQGSTFIYNVFIFMHLFNEINARSLDPHENPFANITKNYIFMFTNLFVVGVQFFIVNNLNYIFKTKKMLLDEWAFSILIAGSIIIYYFFVRLIMKIKVKKMEMGQDDIMRPCINFGNESEMLSLDL